MKDYYNLPPYISINQNIYEDWLDKKAKSVKRRAVKKDKLNHGGLKIYKDAIHQAVCASDGKDFYTGQKLDWSLLSRYNSNDAKAGGIVYMKKFALLPTIDHYDSRKNLNFVICSWIVNDAKSYMSHDEFLELCRKVIAHSDK